MRVAIRKARDQALRDLKDLGMGLDEPASALPSRLPPSQVEHVDDISEDSDEEEEDGDYSRLISDDDISDSNLIPATASDASNAALALGMYLEDEDQFDDSSDDDASDDDDDSTSPPPPPSDPTPTISSPVSTSSVLSPLPPSIFSCGAILPSSRCMAPRQELVPRKNVDEKVWDEETHMKVDKSRACAILSKHPKGSKDRTRRVREM